MTRAAYFREYRKTVKKLRKPQDHQDGVREGIALCIKFARETIQGKALTGFQFALAIDRAMIGEKSGNVLQRERLMESLNGAKVPQPATQR